MRNSVEFFKAHLLLLVSVPQSLPIVELDNTQPGTSWKKTQPCNPDFDKTVMQWFEECETSGKESDISDEETIIMNYVDESKKESEESSDTDSEEEEDGLDDKDNYFYEKGKNRF
ncbi:hypothetical protein NPIL_175571 [Nephila pilipes]|uniref:Spider venom protein n=1 Tax=Nephila pilipes TaxID=299642 RepID=A0A8X6T231_NEPPI|nr:hypothetical protein NPIL_175571 [Nephila pilipes]